jgi:hypothetical protein
MFMIRSFHAVGAYGALQRKFSLFFGLSGSDHVQADGFAYLQVLTAYSTIGQVVRFTECGHRSTSGRKPEGQSPW